MLRILFGLLTIIDYFEVRILSVLIISLTEIYCFVYLLRLTVRVQTVDSVLWRMFCGSTIELDHLVCFLEFSWREKVLRTGFASLVIRGCDVVVHNLLLIYK